MNEKTFVVLEFVEWMREPIEKLFESLQSYEHSFCPEIVLHHREAVKKIIKDLIEPNEGDADIEANKFKKVFAAIHLNTNQVVGFASLFFDEDFSLYGEEAFWAEVGILVVDEQFRRNGIGRLLLAHIEAYCKTSFKEETNRPIDLRVNVMHSNVPALELYATCGFKPFELNLKKLIF